MQNTVIPQTRMIHLLDRERERDRKMEKEGWEGEKINEVLFLSFKPGYQYIHGSFSRLNALSEGWQRL